MCQRTSPAMMRSTPPGVFTRSAPDSSMPAVVPRWTPAAASHSTRVPVADGAAARHACRIPPGSAIEARQAVHQRGQRPRPAPRPDRRRARAPLRATSRAPPRRADTRPACRLMPTPITTAWCGVPMRAALRQDARQLAAPHEQVVRPLESAAQARGAPAMPARTPTPAASVMSGSSSSDSVGGLPDHRQVQPGPGGDSQRGRAGRGPRSARRPRRPRRSAAPLGDSAPSPHPWSTAPTDASGRRDARSGRLPSAAAASSGASRIGRHAAMSERFEFEAQVGGRRRMRQRADRHEVGAGGGQFRDAARA